MKTNAKDKTNQDTIPSAWPPSTLNVAKCRHTSIETETISQDVLNVFRPDRLEVGIMCSLSDNYYGLALSNLSVLDQAE